mmetsp:Transcript_24883/g.53692  ORF Transcript_24883/g.53692 Transcript_24883/m.53692 type:complete len:125 (+) Transcript_24883:150-524(+)
MSERSSPAPSPQKKERNPVHAARRLERGFPNSPPELVPARADSQSCTRKYKPVTRQESTDRDRINDGTVRTLTAAEVGVRLLGAIEARRRESPRVGRGPTKRGRPIDAAPRQRLVIFTKVDNEM